jgi:hypothetical protein
MTEIMPLSSLHFSGGITMTDIVTEDESLIISSYYGVGGDKIDHLIDK